jgi:hypothetical protein
MPGPDAVQAERAEAVRHQQAAGLRPVTGHRRPRADDEAGDHRVASVVLDQQADDSVHGVVADGGDRERVPVSVRGASLCQGTARTRSRPSRAAPVHAQESGEHRAGVDGAVRVLVRGTQIPQPQILAAQIDLRRSSGVPGVNCVLAICVPW